MYGSTSTRNGHGLVSGNTDMDGEDNHSKIAYGFSEIHFILKVILKKIAATIYHMKITLEAIYAPQETNLTVLHMSVLPKATTPSG
jgi:hypothetical protein